MTATVLATVTLCVVLAVALFLLAWPQLALLRRVLRPPWPASRETRARGVRLEGRIASHGDSVSAPLSGRGVLWVRALVLGPREPGGRVAALWSRVLTVPLTLEAKDPGRAPAPTLALDTKHAVVLVTREYRVGTLKALVAETPLLPRMLSRAGWRVPPPSTQLFLLQEELLPAGMQVLVLGELDGDSVLRGRPDAPLVLTTLSAGRLALRVGGGAALAMLLSALLLLTALTVGLTARWLA